MSLDHSELVRAGLQLVAQLRQKPYEVSVKMFGSVAIAHTAGSVLDLWSRYGRPAIDDIDLVASRKDFAKIEHFLQANHFVPRKERMFYDSRTDRIECAESTAAYRLEIFPEPLALSNTIKLSQSLDKGGAALDIGDLIATKLQYKEPEEHDIIDAMVLLSAVAKGAEKERAFVLENICERAVTDYCFYVCVAANISRLRDFIATHPSSDGIVLEILSGLEDLIAETPKSMRWKVRAFCQRLMPVLECGVKLQTHSTLWSDFRRK